MRSQSGDFFSDGSISVLEAGTLWTKATQLDDSSQFEVYTVDSTAAVRGTIFGVIKDPTNGTTISLIEGKIDVIEETTNIEYNLIVDKQSTDPDLRQEKSINTNRNVPTSNRPINTHGTSLSDQNGLSEKFYRNENISENNLSAGGNNYDSVESDTDFKLTEDELEITEDSIDCEIAGDKLSDGNTSHFYKSEMVAYDDDCNLYKEYLTCENGKLKNTNGDIVSASDFRYETCGNAAPNDCIHGTSITHGYMKNFYSIENTTFPDLCSSYKGDISCENGNLIGDISHTFDQCNDGVPANCTSGTIDGFSYSGLSHGSSTTGTKNIPITGGTQTKNTTLSCNNGSVTKGTISNGSVNCSTSGYQLNGSNDGCEFITPSCSTFEINGVCQTGNEGGLNLYAYAPFNEQASNNAELNNNFLKMYNQANNISMDSLFDQRAISSGMWKIRKNISGSNYGLLIDDNNHDDYLEYSNLGLNGNFIIEMKFKLKDSEKRYLIDSSNFRLYIDGKKLKFYNGSSSFVRSTSLSTGNNLVYIKKSSGNIYLKVGNGSWESTGKSHSYNINELIFGAQNYMGNYYRQLDDTLDYIKIYK